MSFILDALKKAERERRLGRARILEVPVSGARRGHGRAWPWLLIAAVVLAAGGLVWSVRPAWLAAPVPPASARIEPTAPPARPLLPPGAPAPRPAEPPPPE